MSFARPNQSNLYNGLAYEWRSLLGYNEWFLIQWSMNSTADLACQSWRAVNEKDFHARDAYRSSDLESCITARAPFQIGIFIDFLSWLKRCSAEGKDTDSSWQLPRSSIGFTSLLGDESMKKISCQRLNHRPAISLQTISSFRSLASLWNEFGSWRLVVSQCSMLQSFIKDLWIHDWSMKSITVLPIWRSFSMQVPKHFPKRPQSWTCRSFDGNNFLDLLLPRHFYLFREAQDKWIENEISLMLLWGLVFPVFCLKKHRAEIK